MYKTYFTWVLWSQERSSFQNNKIKSASSSFFGDHSQRQILKIGVKYGNLEQFRKNKKKKSPSSFVCLFVLFHFLKKQDAKHVFIFTWPYRWRHVPFRCYNELIKAVFRIKKCILKNAHTTTLWKTVPSFVFSINFVSFPFFFFFLRMSRCPPPPL